MASVSVLVLFAGVGAALAWKGGDYLVQASDRLGAYYGLPAIVQGAIIAAVGSSFPELSSIVIATLRYGAFDIGIGAVVGSAVFNILVIPAVSALAGEGQRLASNRDLVYKEAQFYLLSLAVLVLTFSLAVIYQPFGSPTSLEGFVTRPLALIPLALYGLYLFMQYHDTLDHRATLTASVTDIDPRRQWVVLVVSLGIILAGAELLVRSAVGFGEVFGTSPFLWGLTVVAAGTSLPDTFVSVTAARQGNAAMSLANVFGSNVFALLVALPVGILVAGGTIVVFDEVVPMMSFLTGASIVFFAVLRTEMALTRGEAYVLLATYVLFLVWLLAESLGVTSFVG
ncbi:sodium:calcium antiporter [Haloferax sp. MBLA0076]|uniref:Sodium:calcium antiporter n=1 Tax=Haloferax litoreum TaxID=2666140 RepID=A0A6A8GGD3_9EURY|nr:MULTISPECIES: sodium:calcium antiporter [Haloferax]KAB1193425.1 sodium:calcium antiporter [Haloferax sp. CBA1148]MRX21936.1 sodium:calcium antiporter [Haloferax litoreum]